MASSRVECGERRTVAVMPTPEIFSFDQDRLADGETMSVDRLLNDHSVLYVNHLTMALGLDRWREGVLTNDGDSTDFKRGVDWALKEIVAHLRQGHYLPGGVMLAQGEPLRRSASLRRPGS